MKKNVNPINLVLEFEKNHIYIPFPNLAHVDEFTSIFDNSLELVASLNRYLELGFPQEEILDAYLATDISNIDDDEQEFSNRCLAIKYSRDRYDPRDLQIKFIQYVQSDYKHLKEFSGLENILNNIRKKKGTTNAITPSEIERACIDYLLNSYRRQKECYFKLKDKNIRTNIRPNTIDYSKTTPNELRNEDIFMLVMLTNMSMDELKVFAHMQLNGGRHR